MQLPKPRAWVLMERRRVGDASVGDAEALILSLGKQATHGHRFLHLSTLWGQHDTLAVIEHDDGPLGIHGVIEYIGEKAKQCLSSTTTMLALSPQHCFPQLSGVQHMFVALKCEPGNLKNVLPQLGLIPEVLVADVVFGPYDIMLAVEHPGKDDVGSVLASIADIQGVERTVTMVVPPKPLMRSQ